MDILIGIVVFGFLALLILSWILNSIDHSKARQAREKQRLEYVQRYNRAKEWRHKRRNQRLRREKAAEEARLAPLRAKQKELEEALEKRQMEMEIAELEREIRNEPRPEPPPKPVKEKKEKPKPELVADQPIKPVILPLEPRFSGMWVIGVPNTGKTNLLLHLFLQDLTENASLILMDCKGDLYDAVKNLKAIKDRLVLIDADVKNSVVALNPLDLGVDKTDEQAVHRAIEFMVDLFESADAPFSKPQQTYAYNIFYALITAVPNPTLRIFKEFLKKGGWKPYAEDIKKIPNDDIRDFFLRGGIDRIGTQSTEALAWRTERLLQHPILRVLLSAPRTQLDLKDLMDTGAVVVINTKESVLGKEGASFFSRFFIALIRAAAVQRQGQEYKKPVFVYFDEADYGIANEKRMADILNRCRSQKIAMICAHQEMAQIKEPSVKAALADVPIKFANVRKEADQVQRLLGATDATFVQQPRGWFAASIRTPNHEQIKRIQVPYVDPRSLPQMTPEDLAEVAERMKQYTYTPQRAPDPVIEEETDEPVKGWKKK